MFISIKKFDMALLIGAAVIIAIFIQMASAQTVAVDDATEGSTSAPVTVQVVPLNDASPELFVPKNHITAVGTLEMRHEAVVTGPEVRLRQICRWSVEQSASFIPIGDLVIDKLPSKRPKKILLDDLRATLQSAGVNQGLIQFTGSTSCLVSCADAETNTPADDRSALNQWIDQSAKKNDEAAATPTSNLPQPARPTDASTVVGTDVVASDQFHTLRDLLLTDLSERLNIPVDHLQMTIDPKDLSLMNLSEPTFHFELEPRRVRDLGRVSWDVSILTGQSTQKVEINGEARAWEQQLVVAKPTSGQQIIRDTDLIDRRVLMDHIDDDTVLTRAQAVGQQAARDLKPGTVMTARLVQSVSLAKPGQYINVTLSKGGVAIQTVGKAMEAGTFGQVIKVRNEESNEVFEVTLTGPQAGSVGPPAADVKPIALND